MKHVASRALALAILVCLLTGGLLLSWLVPPSPQRFQLTFAQIVCDPAPPMDPSQFLAEVQRRVNLSEPLDTRDSTLLPRLLDAFAKHPWVRTVHHVSLRGTQGITVEMEFREPVAWVFLNDRPHGLDREAVLLPSLTADMQQSLLELRGLPAPPADLAPGQFWPVAKPAVTLAARVLSLRQTLELQAVVLHDDPLQPTLRIQTRGGSIIEWCNRRDPPDESADNARILLLKRYHAEYGGLDAPAGPYHFDMRRPASGLLRQPLRP